MQNSEIYYLNNMLPEIKQFQEEVIEKLNANVKIKELYCGWKVWFSQILDTPDILFIGINPGNGEGGDLTLEPDGELQYLYDKSPKFSLKNDTLEVFNDEEIKQHVDLSNCIKTNYYYLATKDFGSKDFDNITDELGRQNDNKGLGDRFFQNSKKWTKEILTIVSPKLIICEGAHAFDLVTEYALESKVKRNRDEEVFSVFNSELNTTILGYSRSHPRSGIKNKELLKLKLRAHFNSGSY